MTITAHTGPHVVFGVTYGATGNQQQYNEQAGPSAFYQGIALLDDRPFYAYKPGQGSSIAVYGWWGNDKIRVLDTAPATNNVAGIAGAQVPTVDTALTLGASTGATGSVSIVRADTGATVTGLVAIDAAMDTVTFGSATTMNMWDPTLALARNVTITDASTGINNGNVTWEVVGYDLYGYPMTEDIAGSTTSSLSGTSSATGGVGYKAFKYIASVTPTVSSGSLGSTQAVSVGFGSKVGFPIRVDDSAEIMVYAGVSSDAIITTAGTVTVASTATATSTTPDVRGTYGSTVTFDGTERLVIYVSPSVNNIGSSIGVYGVTQA